MVTGEKQRRGRVDARLLEHPLFADLDHALLEPLLGAMRPRHFEIGELVSQPGGSWPALHLLLQGRLCLYELTSDGRRVILDFLEAGGVDGLLELAGLGAHFCAAAAASEVASLSPAALDELMQAAPQMGLNLLKVAVRRLHRREEQLELLALRQPGQRLAGQLLALAEECGNDRASTTWWAPRLSHEALADMLALRRETITLHLGKLRRMGAVRVQRDRFMLDRGRLTALRDGHPARYRSASDLSSSPNPGRSGSGASRSPSARGAPSNNIASTRA